MSQEHSPATSHLTAAQIEAVFVTTSPSYPDCYVIDKDDFAQIKALAISVVSEIASSEALKLAEEWKGRGDDAGRLSRAVIDSAVSARRENPAQSVPDGMWYFTFYCENRDAVQRVRVNANAPREFTCGVTGLAKSGKP